MTDHYTITSETHAAVIEALEEAHGRLEQSAAFADAMYHAGRARDWRRTADRIVGALRRLNREDNNVVPIGATREEA